MAKRFTDAGKWRRPWFRTLSKDAKLIWQYLCDECDHAGVWIADFDLLSFQLDFKVDAARLVECLGDKLVQVDHDKFFIPSFFEFQYGDAKEGFKAKQSALKILKSHDLIEDSTDSLRDLTNSYLSVTGLSADCPSKSNSKSKIKSKSNTGSAEGAQALSVYTLYPRKEGKSDGLKRLAKDLEGGTDLRDMLAAVHKFIAHHKTKGTEANFLPMFSTWTSTWHDWLDPEAGKAEDFGSGTSGGIAAILEASARKKAEEAAS